MNLHDGVESVRGVGEKTATIFRRRNIRTVRDLLYNLPRTYNDWQTGIDIKDIVPGNIVVRAKVKKISTNRAKSLRITKAEVYDDTGAIEAIWFNQDYPVKQLGNSSAEWLFSGVYEFSYGKYQLKNPSVVQAKEMEQEAGAFQPIYKQSGTLKSAAIAKIMSGLKGDFADIPDYLPESIFAEAGVNMSLGEALYLAHFPETQEDVDKARSRLAFDEFLAWSFSSEIGKRENLKLKAPKLKFDPKILQKFVKDLPFDMTDDQRLSLFAIAKDMEKDRPMSRMLQGDVGSGKTVVAMGASLLAADNGFQVAVMAPTQVLARQLFANFRKALSGLRIALLVGGLPAQQKKGTQEAIEKGDFEIIVGTTALISDNVKFAKLGLTIIDEQHRFGVRQRQKLLVNSGSDLMPHLLSMTATPIPRTLQLAIFGEMSVSNIKSKPKGRKEIITDITRPVSIETVYGRMKDELDKGYQVYYVCPAIEEDEEDLASEMKKVTTEFKRLKNLFSEYNVGFMHGKLSAEEKTAIMQDFSVGKVHILVSTTVIEVGVDVPNANYIIIRNADRFGLSALHQLRGRVGRGDTQSYCTLVTTTNDRPTQRLREMERSNDGFYLAEKDLQIRGAGEIYGALQHGALSLRVANITDSKTLVKSRRAAEMLADIVEQNPSFLDEYEELKNILREKQKTTVLN
jgi:ATP-dependent DNA helicase RecG